MKKPRLYILRYLNILPFKLAFHDADADADTDTDTDTDFHVTRPTRAIEVTSVES